MLYKLPRRPPLPVCISSSPPISTMASLLSTATQAAHSAAVSLMSAAEVKPGAVIPTKVPVKEEEATQTFTFEGIKGKNIFVRYNALWNVCDYVHANWAGWYTGSLHWHLQCADSGLYQGISSIQGEGRRQHIRCCCERRLYPEVSSSAQLREYVTDMFRAWKDQLAPGGTRE